MSAERLAALKASAARTRLRVEMMRELRDPQAFSTSQPKGLGPLSVQGPGSRVQGPNGVPGSKRPGVLGSRLR